VISLGLAPVMRTGRAERIVFLTSPSGPSGGVSHRLPSPAIHFPVLEETSSAFRWPYEHTMPAENA